MLEDLLGDDDVERLRDYLFTYITYIKSWISSIPV